MKYLKKYKYKISITTKHDKIDNHTRFSERLSQMTSSYHRLVTNIFEKLNKNKVFNSST